MKRDIDPILKGLGIAPDHPDLIEIGTRMLRTMAEVLQSPAPKDSMTYCYTEGDDGTFPFHHEVQQGTDCGIHAMNTFNHGRNRMSHDGFTEAATQAREHIELWGPPARDADKPGTPMDVLAVVLSHELGRDVRFLQTDLGSGAGIDESVRSAFELLDEAVADKAPALKHQVQAIQDEIKRSWKVICTAPAGKVATLQAKGLKTCLQLVDQIRDDAAAVHVGDKNRTEDRLDQRLESAIQGIFANLDALSRHRTAVFDALFDPDSGKNRGELVLQISKGHGTDLTSLGMGHHVALRWNKEDGTCYLVDSLRNREDPMTQEPMTSEKFVELLGDSDGMEMIVPDKSGDPLLGLLAGQGQGASREVGMNDVGQTVGIGPMAWDVLLDKLQRQLDGEHTAAAAAADAAFEASSAKPKDESANVASGSADGDEITRAQRQIDELYQSQEGFGKLLASVAGNSKLLKFAEKARATVQVMENKLQQAEAQVQSGWTMPAFIAQVRGGLQDLKEALGDAQPTQQPTAEESSTGQP